MKPLLLNSFHAELIIEDMKSIFVSSIISRHWGSIVVAVIMFERQGEVNFHIQRRGHWCPDEMTGQVISIHGIDLIISEYITVWTPDGLMFLSCADRQSDIILKKYLWTESCLSLSFSTDWGFLKNDNWKGLKLHLWNMDSNLCIGLKKKHYMQTNGNRSPLSQPHKLAVIHIILPKFKPYMNQVNPLHITLNKWRKTL